MNKDIKNHYKKLFHKYGDSHHSAQYSSKNSQVARLKILCEIGELRNTKILDFGCGTSTLAAYLDNLNLNVKYTGTDIVEEFLQTSRVKFPKYRFGYYDEFRKEKFDFILIGGVFNNKIDNNFEFFKETISMLFKNTKVGLSCNLMNHHVDYFNNDLWYVKPEDVYSFLRTLSPYITIRNDYIVKNTNVPFDFSFYIYKNPIKAYK